MNAIGSIEHEPPANGCGLFAAALCSGRALKRRYMTVTPKPPSSKSLFGELIGSSVNDGGVSVTPIGEVRDE